MARSAVGTGVDLGLHTVKLVRLEAGHGDTPRVTHWGTEEIQPDGGEGTRARTQALKRLMRRLRLRARHLGRVATAVGGRDIYLRQVLLPRLSEEEFRQALPFEAKKHFPLDSLQDPILDFQVIGEPPAENGDEPGAGDRHGVLLVASPRARRDELLEVLDGAGIDPVVVDAEPLPALNALIEATQEKIDGIMMMVDLGGSASVLAAVDPDDGLYARYLNFHGDRVTRAIQDQLGFDQAAAEAMKRELTGPEGDQITALAEPLIEELLAEIRETVRFLGVRRRNQTLKKLCLCGGASLTAGLRDRLASALGVAVGHPDPFLGLTMGASHEPDPEDRVRLVNAVGLARGQVQGEV